MGDNTIRTDGPKLPVLLLHPWWGVSEGTRWWAEQLTQAGHPVHCPDLYDGTVLTTVEQAASHPRDEEALMAKVTAAADAMPRPYAAVGFSMGAAFASLLGNRGAASPSQLVLFYGGWKPEPGEPGTERVSLHLAETDEYCDQSEVDAVHEGYAVVDEFTYPGTLHWFAEPGAPHFDPQAAETALARVLGQLG